MPVSLEDLSKEFDISASGLRKRIHALGLPVEKGSRGKWVISDELLNALREADRLLKDGAGTNTTRRVLGIVIESPETDEAPTGDEGDSLESDRSLAENRHQAEDLQRAVVAQVVEAIAGQTELAEKYARAAHQIGSLEAENRFLKDQLAEARQRIALLEAPQQEPQESDSRPWWRFWG